MLKRTTPLLTSAACCRSTAARAAPLRAGIDIDHPAQFAETGGEMWDPMGLSTLGSDETLKWFRACELKHGRIAMLATLGWVHQSFGAFGGGLYFPTADGLKQLSVKPLEANAQMWEMGLLPWLQIFVTIGILEIMTEATVKPHYFSAEGNGYINIFGNEEGSAELNRLKLQELKNGRLAMIGITSFFFSAIIPGSVPALGNLGGM